MPNRLRQSLVPPLSSHTTTSTARTFSLSTTGVCTHRGARRRESPAQKQSRTLRTRSKMLERGVGMRGEHHHEGALVDFAEGSSKARMGGTKGWSMLGSILRGRTTVLRMSGTCTRKKMTTSGSGLCRKEL